MDFKKTMSEKALARKVVAAVVFGSMSVGGAAFAAPAQDAVDYGNEEVVVTAERIPSKKLSTPANVTVITAQKIADNNYQTLAEALNDVNGVFVTGMGSGTQHIVNIQGDDRVVLMVDGRRMNNDQGTGIGKASVDLDMIGTLKNIERIEIVKGGGSAIYGSDAIGGVINIITKQNREQKSTLDINYGSWGTKNYQLNTQGSDNGYSWYIGGSLEKQDHYSFKRDGVTQSAPHSGTDNNSFNLQLDKRMDDTSAVHFSFEHRTIHENQFYNAISGSSWPDSRMDEIFNNVSLSYTFKEKTSTPGVLRIYDNYRWEDFAGAFKTRSTGIDYQNGWEIGNNKIIAGIEYHRSSSSNVASGYENKRISSTSVFLQDTISLGNKFNVIPGIRLDNNNKYGSHWSPKIALNYEADKKNRIYASYGRVFRAPSADNLYHYNDMGSWGKYIGNENLNPETGYNAQLGYTHTFNPNSSLDVNFFMSKVNDAIYYGKSVDGVTQPVNLVYEKRRGMEITYNKKLNDNWSFNAGYSYIKLEAENNSSKSYVLQTRNVLPNGYQLGVSFKKGPWKANLGARIGSGLDVNRFGYSRYVLWNLSASYDVTKDLTIYARALNLTNQSYPAYSGYAYPGPSRFFQIGVKYSF